jgi:hypothetical protein
MECAFCGEQIDQGQAFRPILVGDHHEAMHDEPRLCAIRYEFSMLAARLDSATRKGTIDHPAAPITRVEFNKTYSGELLMLLQKWQRNEAARDKHDAMHALATEAASHGLTSIIQAFGSVDDMNAATLEAAVDRRAASEDLERAVMLASDALYDAVFGKEAE